MASARKKAPESELILEDFLPYRLSVLANRVSRAVAQRYADEFDLTIPEWRVMAILGRSSGLTAREVAEATEMDKVAISRAVARLMANKRVSARVDREDARRQMLTLTREGERIYARIAPVALASEARLLKALTPADQAALDRLLDRLLLAAKAL
jgi:DNA-binding MarR family transcriptional regulator